MIKDLAEFQKLLKLCRRQGVTRVTLAGVSVEFGDLPKKSENQGDDDEPNPDIDPLTGLTQEQLMFLSVPQGADQ